MPGSRVARAAFWFLLYSTVAALILVTCHPALVVVWLATETVSYLKKRKEGKDEGKGAGEGDNPDRQPKGLRIRDACLIIFVVAPAHLFVTGLVLMLFGQIPFVICTFSLLGFELRYFFPDYFCMPRLPSHDALVPEKRRRGSQPTPASAKQLKRQSCSK